jgi:hypothetical protein
VQSFGVAPAVIIAFLWGVVIFGLLEILCQEIKLKSAEREWRQWRGSQLLPKDEVRQIAVNFAKLSELPDHGESSGDRCQSGRTQVFTLGSCRIICDSTTGRRKSNTPVLAAGGIIVRRNSKAVIAIVQRKRDSAWAERED